MATAGGGLGSGNRSGFVFRLRHTVDIHLDRYVRQCGGNTPIIKRIIIIMRTIHFIDGALFKVVKDPHKIQEIGAIKDKYPHLVWVAGCEAAGTERRERKIPNSSSRDDMYNITPLTLFSSSVVGSQVGLDL